MGEEYFGQIYEVRRKSGCDILISLSKIHKYQNGITVPCSVFEHLNEHINVIIHRIYQYQQYGYSFSSVDRLLHAMGGDSFLTLMNQTLEETMKGEGFSQNFLNDIVSPITRVNYGQSVRIHGFVGMFHSVGVYQIKYVIIGYLLKCVKFS